MYRCASTTRHIREVNETSHISGTSQKIRRRKKKNYKSSIPNVNIHSVYWQYGACSSCYPVRYSYKKAHNHSVKTQLCMPRRNAGEPPISQEFCREVGIWRSASGNGGSLFKGASNSEGWDLKSQSWTTVALSADVIAAVQLNPCVSEPRCLVLPFET